MTGAEPVRTGVASRVRVFDGDPLGTHSFRGQQTPRGLLADDVRQFSAHGDGLQAGAKLTPSGYQAPLSMVNTPTDHNPNTPIGSH